MSKINMLLIDNMFRHIQTSREPVPLCGIAAGDYEASIVNGFKYGSYLMFMGDSIVYVDNDQCCNTEVGIGGRIMHSCCHG